MHDPEPDVDAASAARFRRRRGRRLFMLITAAGLLHAVALSGADWVWPQAEPVRWPAAAMQVRVVDVPAPFVKSVAMAPALPAPAAKPVAPLPKPRHEHVAEEHVAAPAATAPAGVANVQPADAPVLVAQAAPMAISTPAPAPAPDEETIPQYRTLLPPALVLHYEMQRGMLRGTGDLTWRPQADRYELKLEAKVSGLSVLTQISTGAFDAAGVAPVRYTDQRIRRSMTAANFQRGLQGGADKITFSGSSAEFPLHAGAQDRLSWMVQLAAIVSAEPPLATPGAKIVLYVVGANGDASVWAFRCIGPEAVETRAGPVGAIKFVREPREPYDTRIEVWLDPNQHGLPVRATQKSGPNDDGYELHLIDTAPLG